MLELLAVPSENRGMNTVVRPCSLLLVLGFAASCGELVAPPNPESKSIMSPSSAASSETATLGAGCYWCIEAVLQQVPGILSLKSGFMGGHVKNPTYEEVCGKKTGHAEVIQVTFDPGILSYADLLQWFWKLHDPSQPDGQGNDIGPQYRSAIFYHSDTQRKIAMESKAALDAASKFGRPVVTEITAASDFWPADDDHQDYYRRNKSQGYCRYVIAPKLDKLGLKK